MLYQALLALILQTSPDYYQESSSYRATEIPKKKYSHSDYQSYDDEASCLLSLNLIWFLAEFIKLVGSNLRNMPTLDNAKFSGSNQDTASIF